MTERTLPSPDRYAHLRAQAARQKQTTVQRLKQAIATLEDDHRPVTVFTIKEVSGLDYMTYYRNEEALALFRRHSTHFQKNGAKQQVKPHKERRWHRNNTEAVRDKLASQGDSLTSDRKSPRVTTLESVIAQRDETNRQYYGLLQQHMQCGLTIASLEAQVAKYLEFMEQFRLSLHREEYDVDR